MSRQTMVVLATGAVVGVAAMIAWGVGSGGSTPAPVTTPSPSPRDTSALPPASSSPPAATPSPRASSRASAPAKPAADPEPSLPAAPTTATLHITSDVPDAQVFIDRKFIGNAPVTAEDVAPGTRQINVAASGYDGVAETLEVSPGPRDVMISLKAIRLDQSIAVTHKHRVGSCSGQLTATPAGLRYETDNKNDGFSVPLTGIETFTMDFLAKNLKVKVKGKTYDFTDPGGKADPLYFFHQAVEKVRQRLAKGGDAALAREAR